MSTRRSEMNGWQFPREPPVLILTLLYITGELLLLFIPQLSIDGARGREI